MGKCIVTGGAGFIGSHMVDLLLEKGHEVTVLDNFSTGRPSNLEHQRNNPRLKVHEIDIRRFDALLPLFDNVDWVIHYAALGDIVPSVQRPLEYTSSNIEGTIHVLEASRRNNVKRFVYAASSSCYGIPDIYPTPETAPIRTEYPYALSKYLGEQAVLHWNKVYKLPTISLRFFNVYGPRSRTSGAYGAVFGVFLKQKLAGKPFTVVGDGSQTRDFVFVADVARACLAAAESSLGGEIFNVGAGRPVSVNRLVELLKGEVVYVPKRPGEPDCTYADIAKIQTMLGWKPTVTFEEGVSIMMNQIDYWKNAPLWDPDNIREATADWFKYLSA
ncbi:MAG: SDR family oxidoreductase [Candidatus Omnitrophota bacterium]